MLPGHLALLSLDAVSFAVAAWLSRRLPAVPPAPPRERGGQYQGFGQPAFGLPGWLLLAAAIFAASLALVPVSRWALTNREQYGITSHTG